MGIKISSAFDLMSGRALESKTIQATTTTRDAISATLRYEGLRVYVVADGKNYQLVGGIANGDWVDMSGVTLVNSILEWTGTSYDPYAVSTQGGFYGGTTAPTHTTRLNYGGYFYATRLYDNNVRVSTTDHNHTGVYSLDAHLHAGVYSPVAHTHTGTYAPLSHTQAETTISFTDITTGNATTGLHGYLPRLGGGTTNYLRADGTWAAPPGGAGSMVYPGAGIALSSGSAWSGSITNNSAQWNAAAPAANPTFTGTITLPETFTITAAGGKLTISHGGTPIFSITSAGFVSVLNDVDTFGTV